MFVSKLAAYGVNTLAFVIIYIFKSYQHFTGCTPLLVCVTNNITFVHNPAVTNAAGYEERSTVAHADDESHIGSMRTIVGP